MVVGAGLIILWIPEVRSLKEKRSILTKLIKRTQNEFNISIAEVGDQDNWKSSKIGFSMVGNDRRVINAKADHVFKFVEELHLAEIIGSKLEIVNYSEWLDTPTYGGEKYGDV
ncbi:MAG: DUF503 domain-containing protein [Syntrophales bacterium]|nr:DUF503 domain-containing protein [Syntrophales bacterium]